MKTKALMSVISVLTMSLGIHPARAQESTTESRSELPTLDEKKEDPEPKNNVGLSYTFSGQIYNETLLEAKLKIPNKDVSVNFETSTGTASPSRELTYRFRYAKIGLENDGGAVSFAWTNAPGQFEQKGLEFGKDLGPEKFVTHLILGADQISLVGNPISSGASALADEAAPDNENLSTESRTALANAFQNQRGQRYHLGLETTVKMESEIELVVFANTFKFDGALKTRDVEYSEISGDMASGLNKWDAGFGANIELSQTKLSAKGTWAETQLEQESTKFLTLGADYKITPQFKVASEATIYERSQSWKVGSSYAW
jgi:hypothetical protein